MEEEREEHIWAVHVVLLDISYLNEMETWMILEEHELISHLALKSLTSSNKKSRWFGQPLRFEYPPQHQQQEAALDLWIRLLLLLKLVATFFEAYSPMRLFRKHYWNSPTTSCLNIGAMLLPRHDLFSLGKHSFMLRLLLTSAWQKQPA